MNQNNEGGSVQAGRVVRPGTVRETTFEILAQGDVHMAHRQGYMVTGNDDAVCFYIDARERAYISASTQSDMGCPVIYLSRDDRDRDTELEFSEFKGWRFHAGGAGKTIAVALVRRADAQLDESNDGLGDGLKLYAWQPRGHGELSWFVVAATEAEAKDAVGREIARRRALPWDDLEHIGASEVEGWGSDYYTLTIAERGRPVDNANE